MKQTRCFTARTRIVVGVLSTLLAISQAVALELGSANVRSALGERLLVEIPLGNATMIAPDCFTAALAGVRQPMGMRKTRDSLLLSTPRIVVEPVLELTVSVSCANVARLQRNYTLLIDPVSRLAAGGDVAAAVKAVPAAAAAQGQGPSVTRPERVSISGPTYRVLSGDTVSQIAASITPPGDSIWPVVATIVAANPHAFINGDADRLVAGALLTLDRLSAHATPASPASAETPQQRESALTTARQAAPLTETSRNADTVATATANTLTRADQLLSVLQQPDAAIAVDTAAVAAAAAANDSPFKPVAGTPLPTPVGAATDSETDGLQSGSSWGTRLLALAGGMAAALLAWVLWQIVTGILARRRRSAEAAATLLTPAWQSPAAAQASSNPAWTNGNKQAQEITLTDVMPAPQADEDEGYEVLFSDDDDDETFSFHSAAATVDDTQAIEVRHLKRPADDDFEVTALDNVGMTTIMRSLDEQTQKLLEQDYETELTQTQRLSKAVAERALAMSAGVAGYEDTEEMPLLDDTAMLYQGDTLDDDTTEMDGIVESVFAGSGIDNDANSDSKKTFDLDIDDPSVSTVLRRSAELLTEALDELDDDFNAPKTVKRQA